jgi:hypothetical protein
MDVRCCTPLSPARVGWASIYMGSGPTPLHGRERGSDLRQHMLAPGSVPFGGADAGRRFTTQLLCDRAERRRSIHIYVVISILMPES